MVAKGVAEYAVENGKSRFSEIFRGRDAFEGNGFVARQRFQEFDDGRIARVNEESMIPAIDQMLLCQPLDLGKVHDHAVNSIAVPMDDVAAKRDFQGIAMPVQVPAMAFMIRNAVAGVKLQATSDEHGENPRII